MTMTVATATLMAGIFTYLNGTGVSACQRFTDR
jgi:hypothetical protein